MEEKQSVQVYDEFVTKHRAAYAGFKSIYEDKNPPPVRSSVTADYVSWIIIGALTVVMVASVIVSSSRTIVEFGANFIGVMAFVMLEGGLVAYAFFRARRGVSEKKMEDARKLASWGLGLAFVSAIGANVDNILKAHGIQTPPEINTGINLLVAISAPTLAFISSDVLALELMAGDLRKRKANEEFEARYAEWLDGLNRAWAAQQSRWGVKIEIEREAVQPAVQAVQLSSGQTGHGQGYSRESRAASIVRQHLDAHPEDIAMPVRELADKLGVGKSTVANLIRSMKTGRE